MGRTRWTTPRIYHKVNLPPAGWRGVAKGENFMRMKFLSLLLAGASTVTAFDSRGGWKKDADGKLVLDGEGNPVFVGDDGAERAVKGDTISRLNAEARDHRVRAEKAEEALGVFEGLDAKQAREALDKLSKIDSKTLIDAGEVDKVRAEIGQSYQSQITERDARIAEYQQRMDNMVLDTAFARSEFLANRLAVPREMAEAVFRNQFEVKDNKVVAKDRTGNPIYSKKAMGELASVDEALEALFETYPHRDQVLRANVGSGSGSTGQGGQRVTNRQMSRSEFESLNPTEQAGVAKAMREGTISLV